MFEPNIALTNANHNWVRVDLVKYSNKRNVVGWEFKTNEVSAFKHITWKTEHCSRTLITDNVIYFLSFSFFPFFSLHRSLRSMACLHHATNQMNLTLLNDFSQSKTLNLFEWDLRYADGVYRKSRRPTPLNLMNLVSLSNTIIRSNLIKSTRIYYIKEFTIKNEVRWRCTTGIKFKPAFLKA